MQRQSSAILSLVLMFAVSHVVACSSDVEVSHNGSGGNVTGSGGKATGSGGKATGSGGKATGSGGKTGSGGSVTGSGGSATGSGGSAGSGGSIAGSGGSLVGSGGKIGSGGAITGSGGSGTAGRACPPAADVLADFEEGTASLIKQGSISGWWFVFADTLTGSQTPVANASGPVAATQLPAGEQTTCNKWAYHSTAAGHTSYVGTGATLSPIIGTENKNAVDLSAYSGISFSIKAGSATPVWFEVQTKENQPAPSGTATVDTIDKYNTRGVVLQGIGSTWKTVYVPFAIMGPRWLPSACTATSPLCEAPAFKPANFLGFQFSVYPDFSSAGSYDIWVDDVKLLKGTTGLATIPQTGSLPYPQDAAIPNCTKPTGATGAQLVDAYNQWKATFVTSTGAGGALRVQRPENANDSVSEGIAYGMLLAAYMGDKTTFDGLWTYWKKYPAAGSGDTALMHWQINSGGNVQGNGSATDADEDAAFALLVAGKQWGTTYATAGKSMIAQIYASDIEASTHYVKGGSNFGGASLTNPSYFAPAFYRVFATVDTARTTDWNTVASTVYTALNGVQGTNGLVPAWCSNNCTSIGGGGYTQSDMYQYDSHRTPWRIGLDACWNANASAKAYVDKTTAFFAGKAAGGIGNLLDIYTTSGAAGSGAKNNSMSIIGTAAAGAMVSAGTNATYKAFLDRAYNFTKDGLYAPTNATTLRPWYTYYNATVGLLTLLTMSGNFTKP